MAKRSKNTKTYRVRVVNPAPPPGHPARTIPASNPRQANTRKSEYGEAIRERKYHKGRSYEGAKGTYRTYWHKPGRGDARKGSWSYEVPGGGAKTGFDSEAEAYDWMRHQADYHNMMVLGPISDEDFRRWSDEGDALTVKYGGTPVTFARRNNPQFRYGAVPVSDNGTDTVHVVRGHRRADMVRNVAEAVPGDAMVDMQRTRTFGTKHEAQAYGSTISPRVRSLSRRISGS